MPYRSRITRTADEQELVVKLIDFDLIFTEWEVMDIIAIESELHVTEYANVGATAINDDYQLATWLLDNAELSAVNVLADPFADDLATNEFDTQASLIWYHEESYKLISNAGANQGGVSARCDSGYRMNNLPQPYTVGRNILHSVKGASKEDDDVVASWRSNLTIWGRRRKASSKEEYYDILYRQNF